MQRMYSVFDVKAQVYTPPFLARTDEEAMRMILTAAMADSRLPVAQYPADYQIRYMGGWNEDAGIVADENAPVVLATVEQLLMRAKYEAEARRLAEERMKKQAAVALEAESQEVANAGDQE